MKPLSDNQLECLRDVARGVLVRGSKTRRAQRKFYGQEEWDLSTVNALESRQLVDVVLGSVVHLTQAGRAVLKEANHA